MRLPDWTSRHPLGTGLVACVALGLAGGWLATPVPDASSARSVGNAWKLPTATEMSRFDEKDFLALRQSAAWNSATTGPGAQGRGNAPGQKPVWSLVGVVLEPQPVALILNTASSQVDHVGIGANLPDGSRLQKIHHDSIRIFADGCSTRIDVFRTSEAATERNCKGDAAPAPSNSAGHPDD